MGRAGAGRRGGGGRIPRGRAGRRARLRARRVCGAVSGESTWEKGLLVQSEDVLVGEIKLCPERRWQFEHSRWIERLSVTGRHFYGVVGRFHGLLGISREEEIVLCR